MVMAGRYGPPTDGATHRLRADRAALFVVGCSVALLLAYALWLGRIPRVLAFYAACGAGVCLILGPAMLCRNGAALRTASPPSRGAETTRAPRLPPDADAHSGG
jgi:hypothetical protein